METSSLPLFIAVEIAILAAGHWVPHWKMILGSRDNPVRLIFNYTYGVVSIIAPFIWWLRHELPTSPLDIADVLIAMAIIGGMTVVAAYGIDWIAEWLKNLIETKRLKDAESQRK